MPLLEGFDGDPVHPFGNDAGLDVPYSNETKSALGLHEPLELPPLCCEDLHQAPTRKF